MRGRPKTYDRRIVITTNIEADLYSFGHDGLEIPANEALTSGYMGCIDEELKHRSDIDPEELERYLEIRNRNFRELVFKQKLEEEIINCVSTLAGSVREEATRKEDPRPAEINWLKVPEEKKLSMYIQTIMEEDFRAFWISKYNSAKEEDRFSVTTDFADKVIELYKQDPNKPIKLTEKPSIRKVLETWADSVRGFE